MSSGVDTKEVAELIRSLVLDQMVRVFNDKLDMDTPATTERMWEVIQSGEFPPLTNYYNAQVNGVCDNLKSDVS